MFLETLIEPVAHHQEIPFTAALRGRATREKIHASANKKG